MLIIQAIPFAAPPPTTTTTITNNFIFILNQLQQFASSYLYQNCITSYAIQKPLGNAKNMPCKLLTLSLVLRISRKIIFDAGLSTLDFLGKQILLIQEEYD